MSCSNCFNGCDKIVSDKCVKYTGISIPVLGITTGDTLLSVEENIVTFLLSALDGTGISPSISPNNLCALVSSFLPSSGVITLVDIINALLASTCSLQSQITPLANTINAINTNYTIGCLQGIATPSDTHSVLQSVISTLCSTTQSLNALITTTLPATYVQLIDLNTLIANYLNSISTSTYLYNKMIPYTIIEYYGPESNFDITGSGIGIWSNIYLCNGQNGTPDKRGRVPIGAISGMGSFPLDVAVDPVLGNPNYSKYTKGGSNSIVLDATMIPSHTHTNTATVTDNGHFHYEFNTDAIGDTPEVGATTHPLAVGNNGASNTYQYTIQGNNTIPTLGITSTNPTGISVSVANNNTGGGMAHSNIQPVIACYYIMYIP